MIPTDSQEGLPGVEPARGPVPPPKDYTDMLSLVTEREDYLKKEYYTPGNENYKLYLGDRAEETPFNILYSNTEVLVPNLYSNTPRPVIRKRFGVDRIDLTSEVAQRMGVYILDTNISGYPKFDDAVEALVLDAALPGQGVARVRLVDKIPCVDYVQFDKFVWAYSHRWEDCPWIAFRLDMTQEDLSGLMQKLHLQETPEQMQAYAVHADKLSFTGGGMKDQSSSTGPTTYPVYEVWDKKTKKIFFLSDCHTNKCLGEQDDSLQLNGFFPMPASPLRFLQHTCDTLPRPLYKLYESQANELNEVTRRIKQLARAVKAKGLYNGTLDDLTRLFDSDDLQSVLISAETPAIIQSNGGLDNQIWFLPMEKIVATLKTMYEVRENIKSVIYEILGIGDILRGVSKASETLGAQEIKDKWGSLRVRKAQKRTANYVKELLRMCIELAAKHTPEEMWNEITQAGIPTTIQLHQLEQQKSAVHSQPDPQTGQMTQPPPPPEGWPQVLGRLRDDKLRSYVIDIETNSTIDEEATEDKKAVAEFMNALGQALSGLAPLAQGSPSGFNVAKTILQEVCKRFSMSIEVDTAIKNLQPPPQQGPKMPPEIEQQMKQLQTQLQQETAKGEELQKTIEKLQQGFDQWKVEQESATTIKEAQIAAGTTITKAHIDANAKKEVAKLKPAPVKASRANI